MTFLNRPGSRYYEGVLQLRHPTKVIMEFIKSQLRRREVGVTKEVFVPDGIDIYVTSRKFLRTLSNKLKAQFGGEISLSPRLVTQEKTTQRGVYRVALLYRAPLLRKGDIVVSGTHVVKVKNVAKFVTGTDIRTGKQLSFLFTPKTKALPTHETRVVKVHPVLEVLHPTTYQPIVVTNPRPLAAGEKVRIVFVDHDCYLV